MRVQQDKFYSVRTGNIPRQDLQKVLHVRPFSSIGAEALPRGCALEPDSNLQDVSLGEIAKAPFFTNSSSISSASPETMLQAAAFRTGRGHLWLLFRCVRAQPALIKTGRPSTVESNEMAIVLHCAEKVQRLGALRISLDPVGKACVFLWAATCAEDCSLDDMERLIVEWEVDLTVKACHSWLTALHCRNLEPLCPLISCTLATSKKYQEDPTKIAPPQRLMLQPRACFKLQKPTLWLQLEGLVCPGLAESLVRLRPT